MRSRWLSGQDGPVPGVVVLAILWLAVTAWVRPLAIPDEGRYVGVAWEMIRSGQWLVPTLDGLPYFHKPPLFYWITGGSLSVFGMNEWAARMAPLLGASATALALYHFVRRWSGSASAGLTLLVLATQPLFFLGGQYANLDMLVAGCIAVTVLLLAHAALEAIQGRPARAALAGGYLFAALGLLAKGLIGVVLPGMVIVAWLVAIGRWRLIFRLLWLPGIALFVVVAAPWFVAMQSRFDDFANYFFVVQHFKRFADTGFNNAQPFWFYPVVIAIATVPWFLWLAPACRRAYWSDPEQGPLRKLMWIWVLVVTGFFSLPESKLIGYVLPVSAPLAFLVGDGALALHASTRRMRQLWNLSLGIAMAICVSVVVIVATHPGKSLREVAGILEREAGPSDPIVFLDDYYFDVPFYARLTRPVIVIQKWNSAEVDRRDNWVKELRDAGRFAPDAAASTLRLPADVPQIACGPHAVWLIGNQSLPITYPVLLQAAEVARSSDMVMWRMAPQVSVGGCPEMPSVSSAGK